MDRKVLKEEIDRVETEPDLYEELVHSNLFIIGGVATGKTELMQTLQRELPYLAVDAGKLFRLATYLILSDTDIDPINPDLELVSEGNVIEIERIHNAILAKTRYLESNIINQARFKKLEGGSLEFLYKGEKIEEELDSLGVNSLVSIVAKSAKIREIIWKWINKFAFDNGGVIITGHNLRETDTTDFNVIHLTVNPEIAGQRLMQRSGAYETLESAVGSVVVRDRADGLEKTESILGWVEGLTEIDTSALGLEEVAVKVVLELERKLRRKAYMRKHFESTAIQRSDFHWILNPIMSSARTRINELIHLEDLPDSIPRFDLLMQCLMHLPSYELGEVTDGKIDPLDLTEQLTLRSTDLSSTFSNLQINDELMRKIIREQTERLLGIFDLTNPDISTSDKPYFPELAERAVLNKNSSYYEDGEVFRHLIIPLGDTRHTLRFKPVSSSTGLDYAHRLHYLHSSRHDEFLGFGAYIDDMPYPIAWVSYSKHDRPYKRELFEHLGLESHNILEMTRAWNATWSPKNTMSTLFSYSIKEMRRFWDQMRLGNVTDKSLVGISTTINPNLGFTGSSFSGSSFSTVALRPATLTYYQDPVSGQARYVTRREIKSLRDSLATGGVFDAKIPQLPLNEMLQVFDTKKQVAVERGKIYRIDPQSYLEA